MVSVRVYSDRINFLSVILDPRCHGLWLPPLFDDTKYAHWKVHMKVFLQALGEKVWQAVKVG